MMLFSSLKMLIRINNIKLLTNHSFSLGLQSRPTNNRYTISLNWKLYMNSQDTLTEYGFFFIQVYLILLVNFYLIF